MEILKMMTLQEKKNQIFEFLKGKYFQITEDRYEWLYSLNIFEKPSHSHGYYPKATHCEYDDFLGRKALWLGGRTDYDIKFKEAQQFIQKTLLQDTYIKVNNEEESRWVQELMFSVGHQWCDGKKHYYWKDADYLSVDSSLLFWTRNQTTKAYQIDIPYLEKLFGTKFVKVDRVDAGVKAVDETIDKLLDQGKLSDQVAKLEELLYAKTMMLEESERNLERSKKLQEHYKNQYTTLRDNFTAVRSLKRLEDIQEILNEE